MNGHRLVLPPLGNLPCWQYLLIQLRWFKELFIASTLLNAHKHLDIVVEWTSHRLYILIWFWTNVGSLILMLQGFFSSFLLPGILHTLKFKCICWAPVQVLCMYNQHWISLLPILCKFGFITGLFQSRTSNSDWLDYLSYTMQYIRGEVEVLGFYSKLTTYPISYTTSGSM